MKAFSSVSLVVAALALAAPSRAEAAPRTHDGVYLRVAVGPGFTLGHLDIAAGAGGDSTGVNVSTQLAVGWTVRRGLVLGLGTFPMVTPSPSYDGVDAGGQHVSATGPFIDYYLDPHGGLHAQAGVLFTAGYLDGGERGSQVGVGWGATAGVGYDVFVSDQWSVGGIARLTAYRLFGVADEIRMVAPAALFTVTYH
jgi:hypothetical protein